MVYVGLLRGINVGGNNKVDMKLLKKAAEEAGLRSVVTYINSGNIIFETERSSEAEIAQLLEEVIAATFGLQIKVLIRSLSAMGEVVAAFPEDWLNNEDRKSDVLFLWEEYDSETVIDSLPLKPGIDTVIYVCGALLWGIDRINATKSGMSKIVGTKLYKHVTIRNVNTTRKVYELMLKVKADSKS